jgi:uncharacterized protein YjbI with pentapeptide repeats
VNRVELQAHQIDLRTDWSQRLAAIGTMLTVLAAFVTIYFTTALTERGQVTDRFSKAVDQLGSNQLNVRLGGIYAMERISRDSEDDRQAIDEILTAFIRQGGPPKRAMPFDRQATPAAPDVQAAVTVLGRIPRDERILDLTNTYLVRSPLSGANLTHADLTGANLTGAKLTGADLTGAKLAGANLTGAKLTGANLTGANLTDANLIGVLRAGANLTGANLTGTVGLP